GAGELEPGPGPAPPQARRVRPVRVGGRWRPGTECRAGDSPFPGPCGRWFWHIVVNVPEPFECSRNVGNRLRLARDERTWSEPEHRPTGCHSLHTGHGACPSGP